MVKPSAAAAEPRVAAPRAPLRFGLFFVAWLVVLAVVVLLGADVLAAALKPVVSLGTEVLLARQLELDQLVFSDVQGVPVYELQAVVVTPWRFYPQTLPVDSYMTVTVPRAHTLYHVVLIGAVLLSWPGPSFRQRACLLLAGALAVVVSALIDAPVMLAGQAHAMVYEQFAPEMLDTSWLIRVAEFMDRGGRMLLAASLAAAAVAAVTWAGDRSGGAQAADGRRRGPARAKSSRR